MLFGGLIRPFCLAIEHGSDGFGVRHKKGGQGFTRIQNVGPVVDRTSV
jgi:hypothetical protein